MPPENVRAYLNGGRAGLGTRPVRAKEGPTSPCALQAISEDSPGILRSEDGKKTRTAAGVGAEPVTTTGVPAGDIRKAMRLVYCQLTSSGYGHHDAEEMTAEVMLILVDSYLTPGRFDPARGQLSTLACRVAALRSLGRARRATSRPILVHLSGDPPIASERPDREGALDHSALSEEVRRAVNRLPDQYRQVVELRWLWGKSVRETAAALGTSEQNVRVQNGRAFERLRQDRRLKKFSV